MLFKLKILGGDFSIQVNARWLTDIDVFNEWMNEEDYELADADGSVSGEYYTYIHFYLV